MSESWHHTQAPDRSPRQGSKWREMELGTRHPAKKSGHNEIIAYLTNLFSLPGFSCCTIPARDALSLFQRRMSSRCWHSPCFCIGVGAGGRGQRASSFSCCLECPLAAEETHPTALGQLGLSGEENEGQRRNPSLQHHLNWTHCISDSRALKVKPSREKPSAAYFSSFSFLHKERSS